MQLLWWQLVKRTSVRNCCKAVEVIVYRIVRLGYRVRQRYLQSNIYQNAYQTVHNRAQL
jgi:hypothetical protein